MESKKRNIVLILIIVVLIVLLAITYFYFNNRLTESEKNTQKYISQLDKATGSKKESITSKEFKKYIKDKEFEVYDPEDGNFSSNFLYLLDSGYITYQKDDEEFRINFFEFKNEKFAKYAYYEDLVGNINGKELSSENSLKYCKTSAIIDGNYEVISIIGNTCIWGTVKAEKQDELDKIVSELGY